MRWHLAFIMLSIAGCAATSLPAIEPADVVMLGEQHDAAPHQQLHRQAVERLAAQGRLAALAIEMADQGTSTRGLRPGSSEAEVRAALHWSNNDWPWPAYAPAVLAAVRAGVPVIGANLPRSRMREAMQDASLDTVLPAAGMAAQQEAVRSGHCGLLPESQIPAMARIQLARDRSMAQVVALEAVPAKTVLLIAGAAHVDPDLGVPKHLPAHLHVRSITLPAVATGKDYCEDLRRQVKKPAG